MGGLDSARLHWRVIQEEEPLPGPENMARDEALSRCLAPDQGVLRLYGWDPPTVSLGRNQPARDILDREAIRARGWGVVRRPTGGRAVLHDRELTYSAVFPVTLAGGPRAAYGLINRALAAALEGLGVPARVVGEGEGTVAPPGGGPCFRLPAPGEVTVGGRKVVGSAQVRVGRLILQHGSILLAGSQGELDGIHRGPPAAGVAGGGVGGSAEGSAGSVTLGEILGTPPDPGAVARAVVEGFRATLGGVWTRGHLNPGEAAAAAELRERYGSDEWTWRR